MYCYKEIGNKIFYFVPYYDQKKNVIRLTKGVFKKGDKYRVKYKSGSVQEFEIEKINENGYVDVIGYHSININGKPVVSKTYSSFMIEFLYCDLQDRGQKFHKIKDYSKKFKRIKIICENKL